MPFPHSIGLLYSAFTYFLGFKVNSGEYKLMGLAPYGNPDGEAVPRWKLKEKLTAASVAETKVL
jgi:carbamoyltransferase